MARAGELPTTAVASGSPSSGCEREAWTREATAPLNLQSKAGRPLRRGEAGEDEEEEEEEEIQA
eukprot:5547266-Pyramimonas_sp.AAC.1